MTFTRLLPPGASFVFNDTGDPQSIYVATTGQEVDIAIGTAAVPDTSLNPPVKVVRSVSILRASIAGDGGEQLAAITGITSGNAANQVQTVGIYGGAKNVGTSNGGSGGVDACGVYAVGRILTAGIGTGIGAYVQGRADSNAAGAKANGIEVRCSNFTTVAGTLTVAGFSNFTGAWINCDGNANSSVGLAFGNPFGFQWLTGIHFNAQVNGGFTGPAINESIRDDSTSATSIAINGTHASAAIAVNAGSGPVVVGGTAVVNAGALLEVQGPNADTNPIVFVGSSANSRLYSIRMRNSTSEEPPALSKSQMQMHLGIFRLHQSHSTIQREQRWDSQREQVQRLQTSQPLPAIRAQQPIGSVILCEHSSSMD